MRLRCLNQQKPDGSWKPDANFIHEGATDRYNSNVLRIAAYLAWSLANIGSKGQAVERALRYIEQHSLRYIEQHSGADASDQPDVYTLAVLANVAVDFGQVRDFTRRAMQALADARVENDGQVFWDAQETGFSTSGRSAATETTGLAVQSLLKWGQDPEATRKGLAYLAARKQADGAWGATQATMMALRSLLLGYCLPPGSARPICVGRCTCWSTANRSRRSR